MKELHDIRKRVSAVLYDLLLEHIPGGLLKRIVENSRPRDIETEVESVLLLYLADDMTDMIMGKEGGWEKASRMADEYEQKGAKGYESDENGRPVDYQEYLASEHWKKLRSRKIEEAGGRCQLCNEGGVLNVHHRTYKNLGHEDPKDLTVLCEDCHTRYHQRKKRRYGSMSEEEAQRRLAQHRENTCTGTGKVFT